MEKETLKSLRAKAKDLRSKVSSAPLSRATPDQLRSEILMLERAVKAEEKAKEKRAIKEQASMEALKKKDTKVPVTVKAPADQREKELAKRERELAKREKMLMAQRTTLPQSDSDD
jgi:hypothetical protein